MTLKENSQNEQNKWNTVYSKNPEELPWFGLAFPQQVETYLSHLDKNSLILVPGCGFGDTANKISLLGFKNILGTDISDKAIEVAHRRFPMIPLKTIKTEELQSVIKPHSTNTLDWLNLHQIANIEPYLQSLSAVSNNLCLIWIYEPYKEASSKSYVHAGSIYYHDPILVQKELSQTGLSLKEQFVFTFTTNLLSGIVHEHKAIGQIYAK